MKSDQRLSENAFRRLVRTLSAEQLRDFPTERLPHTIPVDVIDEEEDPRKRQVLDDLAWSRSASELRMGVEATELLDEDTRRALETAETASSHGVKRLQELVADEERAAAGAIDETGRELGEQAGKLYRAIAALDQAGNVPGRLAERVAQARQNAHEVLETVEPALRRYYGIKLQAAHEEMHAREQQYQAEAGQVGELDAYIEELQHQLHAQSGFARRLLKGRAARSEQANLEERLRELIQERNAMESFISEDDLVRWLDTLVDSSLFMSPDTWKAEAQRARLLLYRLLNVYCEQQESAARQVAASQTSQARAKSAAEHYLASEQFVLRYFSHKRHTITAWLSGAASEKLAQFDEIRDAIVTGYRRHARSGGG